MEGNFDFNLIGVMILEVQNFEGETFFFFCTDAEPSNSVNQKSQTNQLNLLSP